MPDEPVTLRRVPVRMFLPPDCQKVTPVIRREREWESATTQWILEQIRRGDTFVDVGAHVGYYTLIVARAVGEEGRVFAFEPDPTNFGLLMRNLRENGITNVVAERAAVSDAPGTMSLYRSPTNSGDHRLADDGDRERVEIACHSLDDYFKRNVGDQRIDVMKVDTQGAEALVLGGMRRLLKLNRGIRILLEFWPYGLARMGSSGAALLNVLEEQGFAIGRNHASRLLQAHTVPNRKHTNLMLRRPAA